MYSTVLVVDDNKEVLISLQYLLKKTFEQVLTLASPESIPQVMNQDTVSVVLLDMNFDARKLDGEEGLFWLNRINEMPNAPAVVLITAFVTSIVSLILFPRTAICGSSGVVFAFILLSSFIVFTTFEL